MMGRPRLQVRVVSPSGKTTPSSSLVLVAMEGSSGSEYDWNCFTTRGERGREGGRERGERGEEGVIQQ